LTDISASFFTTLIVEGISSEELYSVKPKAMLIVDTATRVIFD